ncbi:MAG: RCC1 domain-containing protein [Solirubrobacteraceae bacterium]
MAGLIVLAVAFSVSVLAFIPSGASAEDGLPPGVPVPAWAIGKYAHFYPAQHSQAPAEGTLSAQVPGALPECLVAGGKLCYWGGPVQHEPQLFVIFWGAGFEEGPPGTQELTTLRDFYLGLEENKGEPGEKSWQGILSQYFDNEGPGSIKATVAVIFDKPSSPGEITNASVESTISELVINERAKGVDPTAEAQFIVLPQPNTNYSKYTQMKESCGFHAVDGEGYSYSVIAYAGDVGCESAVGDLAETNGTAAHEFAESATDPGIEEPGKNYSSRVGWAQEDTGNVEVADLCEQYPAEKPANDFWWAVKLWDDNGGNKCNIEDPPYSSPPAPSATSTAATNISVRGATLNGTVNPNGPDAHYHFEYGTTGSYGSSTPEGDAGFGTSAVPESANVVLQPSTTYHYRLVASTWAGTSYGEDKTLTTSATGTVSAGAYHTCALVSEGSIDCWGENYYGQVGNGTNRNKYTAPVAVSGISTAIEVAAGGFHTCALLSGGSVDCWGYNKYGELGDGTKQERTTPVAVSGITNAVQISSGGFHTCAVLSSGKIECWGENAFEQLGDGTSENSLTPVAVSGISTATSVTAGGLGTCATLSGGKVDCWGYGEFGELGDGKTENSSVPVAVSGITEAVAVAAVGDFQACARLSTGTIDCWGDNEDGELGDGTTENSSVPVAVSGISTGADVAAGAFHTCARLAAKTLDCWGENYFGELGDGTTTNSSVPVAVSGIATATGIVAGTSHSCGRLVGGGIDCWGENYDGQLGDGTTTNSTTPVAVTGIT